jgi:ribulose-phosphate 3-epimerase
LTSLHSTLLGGGPSLSIGIMSADLLHLGDELDLVTSAGVRLAHVDVIDGMFCPGLTAGAALVAAVSRVAVPDVHLMVADPLSAVEEYVAAGAGVVTFHLEATRHPHRVLQSLAGRGVVRGVALNPGTPIETLEPLLDDVELVLLLAVNPGWPGQSQIGTTPHRLERVRELVGSKPVAVGIDGGVTSGNIGRIAALQPDVIVAGSAVFSGNGAAAAVRELLDEIDRGHGGGNGGGHG